MFPNFKGSETTEEKVDQITNYLYMLVEQLRYSMANVGKENFNETEFDNIVNLITEPVYLQLSDDLGENRAYIEAEANKLTARIEGVNEALSKAQGETNETVAQLQLSVNGFDTKVESLSGQYTQLQQTVNGFNATVGEINGQYSSITQNVASISAKVDGHDGRFSSIEQSVSNIRLSVKDNADGTASIELSGGGGGSGTIKLTGEVTFQALQDRGYLTSGNVDSALSGKGYVTQTALAMPGTTVIDGGNIKTGTIQGVTFYAAGLGESFVVTDWYHQRAIGGIRYNYVDADMNYADKMYLYTEPYFDGYSVWYPSVKIESAGNISVEAPTGLIYMKAGQYVTMSCGSELTIYIDTIEGTTTWQFVGDALYKNGVVVL